MIKFKKATDSEDQVIDYQILISISGPNGNFRYEVEDYEIVDDYIYAYWYSFGFDSEEVCVKVIASDGELETYSISNVAKLVVNNQNPDPNPEPNPKPKGCQMGAGWQVFSYVVLGSVVLLLKKREIN